MAALVLTAARTNRDLRLPLLGHRYGYHDSLISLVLAVSSAAELVLVLPAGSLMDWYGRAAVLVPCLALMGIGCARWMGLWNSVSGAGGLVGPAIVTVIASVATVGAAGVATGRSESSVLLGRSGDLPRLVPRIRPVRVASDQDM
jgi:MFS family permease